MPRIHRQQSNFTRGVLDPLAAARTDLKQYYNGVSIGRNVKAVPHGGLRRRGGTKFIGQVPGDGVEIEFSFNTDQNYLLVLTASLVTIFHDDVQVATVAMPYTADQLRQVRWAQSADALLLVHPDHAPRQLTRGFSHSYWTLSTPTLSNIPLYNFNDTKSPVTTTEKQDIAFTGFVAGNQYKLAINGEETGVITYSATPATNIANIDVALESLVFLDTLVDVTNPVGTTYRVSFVRGNWPLMTATVVSGSGSIAISQNAAGVTTTEAMISATRGYPRSICFHDSRLWFGGTKSRPRTVLASKVASFFDFNVGTGLDDEAINVTIDGDQINAIVHIHSGRVLQTYTTGGEYTSPPGDNGTLTPENISFREQTTNGIGDVRPISIDGATLFADRQGSAIRSFVFEFVEDSYVAPPASLLAHHLIKGPISSAGQKNTTGEGANYVYYPNGDGTMSVLNTLRSEEIVAWSEWLTRTGDRIRSVAIIEDEHYLLVERQIDGNTVYYVEKEIPGTTYTDCHSVIAPQDLAPTPLTYRAGAKRFTTTVDNTVKYSNAGFVAGDTRDGTIVTTIDASGLGLGQTATLFQIGAIGGATEGYMKIEREASAPGRCKITVHMKNPGADTVFMESFQVISVTAPIHIQASWSGITGSQFAHLYVNEIDVLDPGTLVLDNNQFLGTGLAFGLFWCNDDASEICISDFLYENTGVDFSDPAVRAKTFTSAGRPKYQGDNGGAGLFLTQPAIYILGEDPATNLGSEGDLTLAGAALEDCETPMIVPTLVSTDPGQGIFAIENLEHLEGCEVRVRGDGEVLLSRTVEDGVIYIEREDLLEVEVGLNFNPTIRLMPFNADFADGATIHRRKRYIRAWLDVMESLGLVVNGRRIPDRSDQDYTDTAPVPFTGLRKIRLSGWTDLADLEITQVDPLPLTLRAVALEVEVS